MDLINSSRKDWLSVLELYKTALEKRAEKIKDTSKRKEMINLDKWYQEELPRIIQSRSEKYTTHSELSKLMKWKLSRGKFRPRLQQLVESNSEEEVESASKKAFKKLPNLKSAISELTVLKAVGPATASAVLAAGSPKHAAFMADESMLALPGLQPLQYTLNFYMSYMEQVKAITKRLQSDDDTWTPHKTELALWTHHILKTSAPDILENISSTDSTTSKKRKSLSQSETDSTDKKLKTTKR